MVFSYACIYTQGVGHTDSESAQPFRHFLYSWRDSNPRTLDLQSNSLTTEPTRHPTNAVDCSIIYLFIPGWLFVFAFVVVWFWCCVLFGQSDQRWNCFKGNIGETPERRGGAHMGLPECIDTILNWTELNWTVCFLLEMDFHSDFSVLQSSARKYSNSVMQFGVHCVIVLSVGHGSVYIVSLSCLYVMVQCT